MTSKARLGSGGVVAWLRLNLNSASDPALTSFLQGSTLFRPSYARSLLHRASKLVCTTFITTVGYIVPGAVLSEKPSELMSTLLNGMLRGLDQDSCSTNWTGYISWPSVMTCRLSTRIHSSLSPRDDILFSRSLFRVRSAISRATAMEMVTSSYRIRCRKILLFFCFCDTKPP